MNHFHDTGSSFQRIIEDRMHDLRSRVDKDTYEKIQELRKLAYDQGRSFANSRIYQILFQ